MTQYTAQYQKRCLSESEAAQYLRISRSALRQGRMDGARTNRMPPPPYVKLGKKILYLLDDLDQWLEAYRCVTKEVQS